MSDENESWLPNLVGGVSIWKLAPDLNEEQFFDGRLLVPETEGSDSLPVRVEWDLTGMVPLPEARKKQGAKLDGAVKEFFTCLERTAQVFEKGGSGYDKYKAAFTVPALDADGGAHYFFDPADDKLKVINWGASPRKIRHEKQYLFGYQDFGALIRKEQEAAAARGDGGGGDEIAESGAAPKAKGAKAAQKDAEKVEKEEREEEKGVLWGRPWWVWILYLLGLLFLLVIALAVYLELTGKSLIGGLGGIDADAGTDGGVQAIYGHSADDGGPPATDLHLDAAVDVDAAVDADAGVVDAAAAGDAGPGSGRADAGASRRDAGARGRDAGRPEPGGTGSRERPPRRPDGRPIYGQTRDPSGAWRYWIEDHGRPVSLPHREYYHPDAMQWRIVGGTEKIYDFSGAGSVFRVFLRPGEDFDGVIVQWRDRAGGWHDH